MKNAIFGILILASTSSHAGLMNDTSIWALKSQIYSQSQFGSASPYSYFFDSGALDTGATAAPSITNGVTTEMMTGADNDWSYTQLYSIKADMDMSWPNGGYTITSNGAAGNIEAGIGVAPSYPDAYPNSVPSLESVTASDFAAGTLKIPFTTDPISFDWNDPGVIVSDVLFTLFDSDFQTIFYGEYAGDSQSTGMIDFPFASPGSYEAELIFMNKTTHQIIDGVDVYGGFYHGTILSIDVVPEPASHASCCGLLTLLALAIKRRGFRRDS